MTSLYHVLVLFNAAVCLAVAVACYWRNRYRLVGPIFGVAMTLTALWLVGFAQYFAPHDAASAMWWAKVTLSAGILSTPFLFHSMCALGDKSWRFRWWLAASYALGVVFVVLLWEGALVTGLRNAPYMHHYVRYNRAWYPFLSGYIAIWQLFGVGVIGYDAWRAVGYKRTQLVYFILAWFVVTLTTNSIILPLEYDINIPPFGFLLLPFNLIAMAYVLGKRRLADYNVVIARLLLHSVTLVMVAGSSLLFIGVMSWISPGFFNPQQMLFVVAMMVAIGLSLVISLPRFLPRAERIMQERMFGKRYGYQDALGGLVRELSRMPNLDEILAKVATAVHSQMQVSRVLILMQDPLSGHYKLDAESGITSLEDKDVLQLGEASAIVAWLGHRKDALVREEVSRRLRPDTLKELTAELDMLKVSVCIPMMVEERLTGILCLGEKANRNMFFVSDLRLLENLATEIALAVKYRRMEDEIFRKNKLIELGTIAAGVAHEIRNPLASIRTFAQLMPERMDDPEFTGEFSKLVIKDVERITKVVESMLAFARPAQVSIAEHSAADLIEEAILLVQARLRAKRIELTRQYHEQPVIKVDKQKILQVLVNLLSNAADALPEQGKIRVSTGVRTLMVDGEDNRPRPFAVIEVSDNGPGIPAAVRNRLFDPFFTTKKEGTGLGLSISQKIARDHGGSITVSSIEGKGTTFQVNLPLEQVPAKPALIPM